MLYPHLICKKRLVTETDTDLVGSLVANHVENWHKNSKVMALDSPLLPSIDMPPMLKNNETVIDDIKSIHQSFMNNGNSVDTTKLIEILGGSDAIIQYYLSSNALTTSQLTAIKQLFESVDTADSIDTTNLASPVLIISSNNTFLHRILSRNTADKIISIISSRIMIILFTLTVLIPSAVILALFFGSNHLSRPSWTTIYFEIYFILAAISIIIYEGLCLLSMNVTATKLILETFEFWFKLYYSIQYTVCIALYYNCEHISDEFSYTWSIGAISFCFVSFLILSLVDGLRFPLRGKLSVLVLVSIIFSIAAYQWTFISLDNDYSTTCFVNIFSYNLKPQTFAGTAARIIAMFAWKQTLYAIFKEPKSSLIKKSVKIMWL